MRDTLVAQQSRGLNAALVPDSAYGRNVDPNGNASLIWLDRFGGPLRILDPALSMTLITRGNSAYPGLVTRVRKASGQILGATYDGRGNIASVTDSSTANGSAYATTSYQWDGRWDIDTLTTLPLREYVEAHLDTATGNKGNPLWRQDRRGTAGRIYFSYNQTACHGLLTTDSLPATPRDSILYDHVRCNLLGTRTPMGRWTFVVTDSVGRDTLVDTPIDSADNCTTWTSCAYHRAYQRHAFSVMDRDSVSRASADSLNGAGVQTAIVGTAYDAEGNVVSVVRKASPDTIGLDSLRTATGYDALGRVVSDTDVAGGVTRRALDAAGNVDTLITRRGYHIVSTYDKLNRLSSRTDASVAYKFSNAGFPAYTGTLRICSFPTVYPDACAAFADTVSRDSAAFAYDAVGNIVEGDDSSSHVSRLYLRNGRLQAETQAIRDWADASFANHKYSVKYHYDLDGRRDTLYYPSPIAPAINGVLAQTAYAYDSLSSWLHTVTDPMGNTFTIGYIARGDPDTLYLPDNAAEVKTYDNDGNMVHHTVGQAGTTSYTVRNDSVRYDGRGKAVRYKELVGADQSFWARYAGLGQVVADSLIVPLTGGANDLQIDKMRYDALGNMWEDSSEVTDPSKDIPIYSLVGFQSLTGRTSYNNNVFGPETDSLWHDGSGNVTYDYALFSCAGSNVVSARASFYSAQELLAAADARQAGPMCPGAGGVVYREREWYRYDAFGRRVLIAARDTNDAAPSLPYSHDRKIMRRVVWDGSQEIAEVQVQDSAGFVEMDTGHVALARSNDGVDNNPFYGQALFTFGFGIDRPLSVTRINYADASDSNGNALAYFQWPIITIVPLWNALGRWETGIFPQYYEVGNGDQHSLKLSLQLGWHSYALASPAPLKSWFGSVLQDKLDEAGTAYRRARVYDPATGQFTQEDPLGLAGGLNDYAFANGDPINYDDPFGLCPPADNDYSTCDNPLIQAAVRIRDQAHATNVAVAAFLPAAFAGVLSELDLGGVAGKIVGALSGAGESRAASELTGDASEYVDITRGGSVANRRTDMTQPQFEQNLLDEGFEKTVSADGKANNFAKNGAKYSVRGQSKSTGGPTADYTPAGESKVTLKIRLQPPQ